MKFRRLNPASRVFRCSSGEGDFKIRRPSGATTTRRGLEFDASGHNYDVRLDGREIWLLDDERLIGYAKGDSTLMRVLLDDESYLIEQPRMGQNRSTLSLDGSIVGEFRGKGFPLRLVHLDDELDLNDEQRAFLVMVALVGWREGDRQLLDGGGANSGGGASGSSF